VEEAAVKDWMQEVAEDCNYWNMLRLQQKMSEEGKDASDLALLERRWMELRTRTDRAQLVRHFDWGQR
jgi:hypothetical protein